VLRWLLLVAAGAGADQACGVGGCWAARLKLETQKATGRLRYCRDSKVSSATARNWLLQQGRAGALGT
jgi:hypothetical protein